MIFKTTSAARANYICRKLSLFIINHSYYFGIIKVMKDFQNEVLSTLTLPNTVLVTGDKFMCSTSFNVTTNLLLLSERIVYMQNVARLTQGINVLFKLIAFLCHFNLLQVTVCKPSPFILKMKEMQEG